MTDPYEGWAIIELFGHRKLGGHVSQAEQYGTVMLRIDVPHKDGSESTHFHGGAALFGVHPVGEEEARCVAASCDPAPVKRWELPALSEATAVRCVGCGNLENDCYCEADPCPECVYDPPTGEPPDVEASTEPCAICKPGHLSTEHEPF